MSVANEHATCANRVPAKRTFISKEGLKSTGPVATADQSHAVVQAVLSFEHDGLNEVTERKPEEAAT